MALRTVPQTPPSDKPLESDPRSSLELIDDFYLHLDRAYAIADALREAKANDLEDETLCRVMDSIKDSMLAARHRANELWNRLRTKEGEQNVEMQDIHATK